MKKPAPSISPTAVNARGGAGLIRFADGWIGAALERIESPGADRAEDVHFVRVAIKRLRSLLRLIRPVIGVPLFARENKRLGAAAQRLSLARDRDVAWLTLSALAKPPTPRGQRALFAAAAAQVVVRKTLPSAKREQQMAGVARSLRQCRRSILRLRLKRSGRELYEPGLRRIYRQARKRMDTAAQCNEAHAFHRWRIRVKNLYYALEMLGPMLKGSQRKRLRRLRSLQKSIGDDHDLIIVKTLLERDPAEFGGRKVVGRLVAALEQRSAILRRDCLVLGKVIFAKKPRKFCV